MNVQKNSLKNTLLNVVLYLVRFLCAFVARRLIIVYVGIEVLGVNSVIVDTISLLSLCELGIQTSIIFKMYSAIAKKDYLRVNQLYSLFRYAYKLIGILIIILGVCLLPFISNIIKTNISMEFVYSIYFIQLIIVSLNYLYSCPRLLYLANQKQSVYLRLDIIFQCLIFVIQVIILILFKNYLLYIGVCILNSIIPNIYLKRKISSDFSYINYEMKPTFSEIKKTFYDIKDILFGSVATFVYTSTDNFIISAYFGVLMVGLIVNYKTLTNSIKTIIELFSNTMSPVWGNYLYKENSKYKIFTIIRMYNFIEFVLCSMLILPCVSLCDGIIKIWLGEDYLIEKIFVYLIVADLFLNALQQSFCMILRSYGLFNEDKIICILAAIINLCSSVLLSSFLGVEGVFVGTLIALLYFLFGRMNIALRYLKLDTLKYYKTIIIEYIQYISLLCLMILLSSYFCEQINFYKNDGLCNLLLCTLIDEALLLFTVFLFYYKSERLHFLMNKIIKPILR